MLLKKAGFEWPLWLELSVIIAIKVLLIFCLWKAFFSAPVAKHMVVPAPLLEQQFMGASQPSAPANVSPVSTSSGRAAPSSSCGDLHAC